MNQPCGGATFYFTAQFGLGAAACAPVQAPADHQAAAAAISFPGLPIRLAVDPKENRFLFLEYLKALGGEIEPAESGRIAVEKFCPGAFGLVLMDPQMPEMDGFAATRRIRG